MMKLKQLHLLCCFSLLFTTTLAQSPAPAPPGPTNITKILEKAGQYTLFIRLLKSTQVADQINHQLNDTNNGLTVFAPPDNAFTGLQAGTLNSLTDEQKSELVQFHILPNFVPLSSFQTVSNPLRTQAGDTRYGQFPLNVTTAGSSVNITTGIVNTTVSNTIYTDGQLAVYQVDQVLLPLNFYVTPAPAPAPTKAKKKSHSLSPSSSTAVSTDTSSATRLTWFSTTGVSFAILVIVAAIAL